MTITELLKQWLVENAGVAADATDDEFRAKALECIAAGKLAATKLAELTAEVKDAVVAAKAKAEDLITSKVGEAVGEALSPVLEQIKSLGDLIAKSRDVEPEPAKTADSPVAVTDEEEDESIRKRVAAAVKEFGLDDLTKLLRPAADPAPAARVGGDDPRDALLAGTQGAGNDGAEEFGDIKSHEGGLFRKGHVIDRVRVKAHIERYEGNNKSDLIVPDLNRNHMKMYHPLGGRQAMYGNRPLYNPSDQNLAVAGSWFRWAAQADAKSQGKSLPRYLQPTEEDEAIVMWALHNCKFTGLVGGGRRGDDISDEDPGVTKVDDQKLTPTEIKAVLDDATSGGLEVVPIEFDDRIITLPVLFGELFPLVDLVNVARGRLMEAATIGNPTFTSGTAEGTEIGLFSTTSLIAALNTTIYNAVGAMEIGRDFQEDSPVNIAGIISQKYGEKALEWLDNQVANGDGTTEPEGIFNASGTTAISFENGTTGPGTVADHELLLFGLGKEFRSAATRGRQVFISNDTSYQRARAIGVGATDQRRVFGMDEESYQLFGHPYKVQNDIGNQSGAFVNMAWYRMYRRLGLTIRFESGGDYLVRRNLDLIVVRMRHGGQMTRGAAAAVASNLQA